VKASHQKSGKYSRVADHLYRYSVTKKYYAVIKVAGKTKWISLKTTDREIAGRNLKTEITKLKGTDPHQSKMTLESLLTLYEQSIQGLAEHTQATRKSILKAFRQSWPHGFGLQVSAITPGQIQLWLSQHQARLKNSSYNEYLRFLRHVFAIATNHRVIVESPVAAFKQLRVEKPVRQTPTWEQFLDIVADIRKQKFNAEARHSADLVEFMGRAGVGTAECANLMGEHIDFTNGRITLYRKKTDTGYVIPIYPQVKTLLEGMQMAGLIEKGKPVFKVKDPKKALDAACKRLKLAGYSSRALRRCFITRAVENGIDFKTIAAWQGHQDGGVLIAKTYSHLRNEHAEKMAEKMTD
jgi:integrase